MQASILPIQEIMESLQFQLLSEERFLKFRESEISAARGDVPYQHDEAEETISKGLERLGFLEAWDYQFEWVNFDNYSVVIVLSREKVTFKVIELFSNCVLRIPKVRLELIIQEAINAGVMHAPDQICRVIFSKGEAVGTILEAEKMPPCLQPMKT